MKKSTPFLLGVLIWACLGWLNTPFVCAQQVLPKGFVPANKVHLVERVGLPHVGLPSVQPVVETASEAVSSEAISSEAVSSEAVSKGTAEGVARSAAGLSAETKANNNCGMDNFARLRIPSRVMCAGEEFDFPVYAHDLYPKALSAFQFRFDFYEADIIEPVYRDITVFDNGDTIASPIVTSFDPGLRGSIAVNYIVYAKVSRGIPSHSLVVSLVSDGTYTLPRDTNQHLFKIRVRCKKMGTAQIKIVLPYDPLPDPYHDRYTAIWYGSTCDAVPMSYDHPATVVPGVKPKVKIMKDTTLCVKDKIRLWAEGGVRYRWEDISTVNAPYDQAIAEPRVQYPIFYPVEPGMYTYHAQITDTTGCYAYDTIHCLVVDNTLNLELPQDTIVDSNGVARLDAVFWGDTPPYTLSWTPDSLVPHSVISGLKLGLDRVGTVSNLSSPLREPQMFTVTINGQYCSYSTVQRVNVKGSDVKAYINPFPIIRCAGSKAVETTRLNVLTQGGVGPFNYEWSFENLEPGSSNPTFDNAKIRNPQVTYFSRCAFTVRINDWGTGKVYKVSDTMKLKNPTYASIHIKDHNGAGPFCEASKMIYTSESKNSGPSPIYSWTVNGREMQRSEDTLFVCYELTYGDTVSCALYSNEVCVLNPIVIAPPIAPAFEFPEFPSAMVSYGSSKPAFVGCGDSLSIKILYKGVGAGFDLKWLRNKEEVVCSRQVHTANALAGKGEDTIYLARRGYYDNYSAILTKLQRSCKEIDTVYSDVMYTKLDPTKPLEVGRVETSLNKGGNICDGTPFVVYAKGIENLPETYCLKWYKNSENKRFILGYYYVGTAPSFGDDLAEIYADEFSGQGYLLAKEYYQKGFPLYLNQTRGGRRLDVKSTDSIYYEIECTSICRPGKQVKTSPFLKVETIPNQSVAEVLALVIKTPVTEMCEGAPIRFKAVLDKPMEGLYYWYYNKASFSSSPTKVDTFLVKKLTNGPTIGVRFYSTELCISGSRWSTNTATKLIQGLREGVSIEKGGDTLLCSGAETQIRAWPEGVTDFSNWKTQWASSLANLETGPFLGEGVKITVKADSALFGDRHLSYLTEDTAVVGVQTFYAKVSNINGCKSYDSVRVTVGFHRKPSLQVVPSMPFPWCGSDVRPYFRLQGHQWGANPRFACMDKKGDFFFPTTDSVPFNSNLFGDGLPLVAGVLSSMKTCTAADVYDTIYPQIREQTTLDIHFPDLAACAGDTVEFECIGYNRPEWLKLTQQGYTKEQVFDILAPRYTYCWTEVGKPQTVLSTERFLRVAPLKGTQYRVEVQDTAMQCASVQKTVRFKLAVPTHMDLIFTDVNTHKEVPFSMCAGADSVLLSWKVKPQNFSGKALLGFAVRQKGTLDTRFILYTKNPDTLMQAWFKPQDEFMYVYEHDTTSCKGPDMLSGSLLMTRNRLPSPQFKAYADTVLCPGSSVRLRLEGALSSIWPSCPSSQNAPNPPVEWLPITDLDNAYTFTPLSTPTQALSYVVCAYNEYGCLQMDTVRVGVHQTGDVLNLQITGPQGPLCGEDTALISINAAQSSVLSVFDSLVWKRNGVLLATNVKSLRCHVQDRDSIWVEGFVFGTSCTSSSAVKSNKIGIEKVKKAHIKLSALNGSICRDSTVGIQIQFTPGSSVEWSQNPNAFLVLDTLEEAEGKATLRLRGFKDFEIKAAAYYDLRCLSMDSVKVQVQTSLDTSFLALRTPAVVCGTEEIKVEIQELRQVDQVKWYVNGILFEVQNSPVLGISGAFANADSIRAIGTSFAKCVWRGGATDAVKIRRGSQPKITWLSPAPLQACLGEDLVFEASVPKQYTMKWYRILTSSSIAEPLLAKAFLQGEDSVYRVQTKASENYAKYRLAAYNEPTCATVDSIQLSIIPSDSLSLSIRPSTVQICAGEEVLYKAQNAVNIDSLAWYVNQSYVGFGESFSYKPFSSDTVYAQGFTRAACVKNQGVLSNKVTISVLTASTEPISIHVKAEADSVCEVSSLRYSASGSGFDQLYWFANGGLVSSQAAVSQPILWEHKPRLTLHGLDSVWAMGVRNSRICAPADSQYSSVVSVYHRAAPKVQIIQQDTLIPASSSLSLTAQGASAYLWWPQDLIEPSQGASVVCYPNKTTLVYSIGYEPRYQKSSETTLQNVSCYTMDSIRIAISDSVIPPVGEQEVLYIPNALVLNAPKVEDRTFKVYGSNIASVKMEIYAGSGLLLFSANEANPVWSPSTDLPSGNYAYQVWVSYTSGVKIKKQGWISVIR